NIGNIVVRTLMGMREPVSVLMLVPVEVFMVSFDPMRMILPRPMRMSMAEFEGVPVCRVAPQKQVEAQPRDRKAGDRTQPGIKPFRDDIMRGIKRDGSQDIDACCMRRRNNHAQQASVTRGASRSYQVGGHNGLAVPRFERMQGAQSGGDERGGEEKPETELPLRQQFRKAIAGRSLFVSFKRDLARLRNPQPRIGGCRSRSKGF